MTNEARQTITTGMTAITEYIQKGCGARYPCECGGRPRIIVDATPGGHHVIRLCCHLCNDGVVAFGSTHIEALETAFALWDSREARRTANHDA